MRRLLLLALIAAALAPGTVVRSPTAIDPDRFELTATPLSGVSSGVDGSLKLTGAWELAGNHDFFGGFSALVALDEETLLVGSDRGWVMRLPVSGETGEPSGQGARFSHFAPAGNDLYDIIDLEAFTRDPHTGTLWAAFENGNAIERIEYAGDGSERERTSVRPPAMRRWSFNSGPETMLRLHDGAFLVLSEGPERNGMKDRPGLLFPDDPVERAEPLPFRFGSPVGYSPVDGTLMPDGTVLILLRRVELNFPAKFDAMIMQADPAAIAPEQIWTGQIIARLSGDVLGENFEGIAYVASGGEENTGAIYLVADDNFSVFQRNLVVRFAWPPKP